MELYFVTGNEGKVLSARRELAGFDIEVVQKSIEVPEVRSYDLQEIARGKAIHAYQALQHPLIVLDSGFYLDRYRDFPGPFTNHALHGLELEGILKLLVGEERGCEFRNVLAYMDGRRQEPEFFRSVLRGHVPEAPMGEARHRQWSELHRIFIPEGFEKTLAEMYEEEYMEYFRKRKVKAPLYSQVGEWLAKEHGVGRRE